MDDILTYSKRSDHTGKLIDLFKAVIRNGLKMSPRKCKLFKKSLVFMGLTMMIEDGMPKMKPLKSRIEAILKVKPPTTVKECRSFCGMVNYMSIFLPSLQEKLIPIYFITRKGVPFYWGEEQQKAFDSIKQDVTNAPVLLMPNTTGHFVLVSDTSKIGCGVIGTVYPNIPLSSASIHGHPRSPLGATLGVCMSATAYGNLSTMSSVWPISASRLNLRPRPLSI